MAETPHFPQEFPGDSIRTCADIIFNGELGSRTREFGLHAYWIEGYGLDLALPVDASAQAVCALAADDADKVLRLDGALKQLVAPAGFFDNRPLLKKLIEIGLPLAIEFIRKKYGL